MSRGLGDVYKRQWDEEAKERFLCTGFTLEFLEQEEITIPQDETEFTITNIMFYRK